MHEFHLVMCVVSKILTKLNKCQIYIELIKVWMNKYYDEYWIMCVYVYEHILINPYSTIVR